jgi:hypothetical protein
MGSRCERRTKETGQYRRHPKTNDDVPVGVSPDQYELEYVVEQVDDGRHRHRGGQRKEQRERRKEQRTQTETGEKGESGGDQRRHANDHIFHVS